MGGTILGGKKAAQTNKAKYGEDYYRRIGADGGALGRTGGFAAGDAGRERARVAGSVGGKKSRRPGYLTVTFNGRTQTLAVWAKEVGLSRECLYERVYRLGWPVERALSTSRPGHE